MSNLRNNLSILVLFSISVSCFGGDWPQIHGPKRNGVADGEDLLRSWPAGGPTKQWEVNVGIGYGGAAISNGVVYLFHRMDEVERLEAFQAKDGKSLWQRDFPAFYRGGIDSDIGPRCVPVVAGDKIVVFGAAGDLHCVSKTDGSKVWSRELYRDYRGDLGYFGAGSTPIVMGKSVLVNVGGRGAGIVAVGLADGKTLWSVTGEKASYSSPVAATIAKKPVAIFLTRLNTVAVDPMNGKEVFRFEHGKLGPTVNAAAPLVIGNKVFVTASYRVGARLVKVGDGTAEEIWSNDESMSSQYNSPVEFGGNLYGVHGREDVGRAALRCVSVETGKVRWSAGDIGVAHLIRSKDLLLVVEVTGKISLVQANPEAFKLLGSHTATGGVTRALPALSNGKLVIRTTGAQGGKLICLQVGK